METKEALKNSKHTLRDRQRMKGGERERAGGLKKERLLLGQCVTAAEWEQGEGRGGRRGVGRG